MMQIVTLSSDRIKDYFWYIVYRSRSEAWVAFKRALSVKALWNTDMRKNFVTQTPWNLSDMYNMVYSLVLTNKIDSPREYFRVLDLQSVLPSDISK